MCIIVALYTNHRNRQILEEDNNSLGGHHLIPRGELKTNYLFQPGSATRLRFQILLQLYIEQFLK